MKRSTAKQESFKKKILRLRGNSTACCICNDRFPGSLEAAHIIDLAFRNRLETEYVKDNSLPLSVNDAMNGLLLCANCHLAYDKKSPLITISVTGVITVHGDGLKTKSLKCLNKRKVSWAEHIGSKDYPSVSLLRLRLKWKVSDAGKRKRDMDQESEESEESDECEAPKKKVKTSKKNK